MANPAKHDIAQLTAPVETRLQRMQYHPGLIEGFLAGTRLDLTPLCNPRIEDRLAIIRRWKETGRTSLEEIADILAGREPPGTGHMSSGTGSEALRVQIKQMEAAMASRRGLPAQITPGKVPGEAAVTWALTSGRHNSESQAMRPAAGGQCGVRRSVRGEEWK